MLDALCWLAVDAQIDLAKYVDARIIDKARQMRQSIHDLTQQRRTALPAGKPIKVTPRATTAPEFDFDDPVLPKHVFSDARRMATQAYFAAYLFENSIRYVIKKVLGQAYGEAWWNAAVAKLEESKRRNIERRVTKRIEEEQQRTRWHGKRGPHQIFYTDLPDLLDLILAHWQLFEQLFPEGKRWVELRIEEFRVSRNVVMHSNPLSEDDIQRLHIYYRDWCRQLRGKTEDL
jgi:hypothetical protein